MKLGLDPVVYCYVVSLTRSRSLAQCLSSENLGESDTQKCGSQHWAYNCSVSNQ